MHLRVPETTPHRTPIHRRTKPHATGPQVYQTPVNLPAAHGRRQSVQLEHHGGPLPPDAIELAVPGVGHRPSGVCVSRGGRVPSRSAPQAHRGAPAGSGREHQRRAPGRGSCAGPHRGAGARCPRGTSGPRRFGVVQRRVESSFRLITASDAQLPGDRRHPRRKLVPRRSCPQGFPVDPRPGRPVVKTADGTARRGPQSRPGDLR